MTGRPGSHTTRTMNDLRYPIGRFGHDGEVTDEDFGRWVEDLETLPARLRDVAGELSDVQLDTPYRPGGWTVRQVVHHLVDSHMNGFCRLKFALVEDDPEIKANVVGLIEREGW